MQCFGIFGVHFYATLNFLIFLVLIDVVDAIVIIFFSLIFFFKPNFPIILDLHVNQLVIQHILVNTYGYELW